MLYGIISDIHANLPALEAVLARLRDCGADRILCLGDIVGYGASPNECCTLLGELGGALIRGNHDDAAVHPGKEEDFTPPAARCIQWTRRQLTQASHDLLASLETPKLVDGIGICHGSWPDQNLYTTSPRDAVLSMSAMQAPLGFFGHTHYAEWYEADGPDAWPREIVAPDGGECSLVEGRLYFINPGSVGQPRDGNSCAAYATYDDQARQVKLERVPYNVKAAQNAIVAAGLPMKMATRLLLGI